ncbi:MAG: efflux RND transporter periplasmic adaptor subunit [Planctomycetes bacterium]|nr:efflux RND transporter periplasmic adaptor subunit [Planctomycetota bacterium]
MWNSFVKSGTVVKVAAAVGIILVAAILLLPDSGRGEAAVSAPPSRPPVMVRLTEAREMDFYEAITSDGSIKTRFSSLVAPRISGVIDDIHVREGDIVQAGKTRLFQVDNEKLLQALDHSRQSLVIARSSLDEKKASREKAVADVEQAEKDFARTKSLYEEKVMTLSQYEADETKVKQLRALLAVSDTNVTLAEQNVTLAEISLAMAEKDYRDSVMYAPIEGVVSGRFAEPGEMGSPGNAILQIDDTKNLKATAYLPGQYYPRILPGKSVMRVSVLDRVIGEFPVAYRAPGIDSALRTFEIWAEIPGDGEYAVPGAQCVITVVLQERHGVGVPRDAIQHRDGRQWLFVPDGDVAKIVAVTSGLETDGWAELVDAPVAAGDRRVTQGQFLLNDGFPIREQGSPGT